MRNDDLDAKGKDVGGSAAANGAAAVARRRKKRRSWSAEEKNRIGGRVFLPRSHGRGPALRRAQPVIGGAVFCAGASWWRRHR